MSVKSIVDAALKNARAGAGGTEKTASTSDGKQDLIKEAQQVADALEYLAGAVVDDGTAEGAAKRADVEGFFKGADTKNIKGPAESVSPTGTQAQPPQSGATKIPTKPTGTKSPAESEAPTGTQATIGQPPGGTKTGSKSLSLLDMLTKQADGPSNSPTQSTALQDTADPGKQNENSNVNLLESEAGIVGATKRDAKLPTRARLKALFASASDTGPSSAAAKAAFPTAYAKGGMKVAEAERESEKKSSAEELTAAAGLFDKAASGALGDEAKQFADYVESITI